MARSQHGDLNGPAIGIGVRMANDITSNPIVIDTAATTALTTVTFHVTAIRWVSASASAGDAISLKNAAGKEVYATVASGSNYVEESHFDRPPIRFVGLIPATVGSGTVYLYVDGKVPIE